MGRGVDHDPADKGGAEAAVRAAFLVVSPHPCVECNLCGPPRAHPGGGPDEGPNARDGRVNVDLVTDRKRFHYFSFAYLFSLGFAWRLRLSCRGSARHLGCKVLAVQTPRTSG